jgi:hypothetical protein
MPSHKHHLLPDYVVRRGYGLLRVASIVGDD